MSGKAALALTVHGLAQGEDETAGEAGWAAQSELEHVQTGSHSELIIKYLLIVVCGACRRPACDMVLRGVPYRADSRLRLLPP